jgi:hypothetical protein
MIPRPLGMRADKRDAVAAGVVCILVSLIFTPLLNHLVRGHEGTVPYTDHPAHNAFAADMRQRHVISMPHPVYHLTVIGIEIVKELFQPGLSKEPAARSAIDLAAKDKQGPELTAINQRYASASVVVLVLFQAFLALILYAQLKSMVGSQSWISISVCVLMALSLMIAAPIALYVNDDHQFYFGYIGINVWHNPTVLAAKPWGVIIFILIAATLINPADMPSAARRTIRTNWLRIAMPTAVVVIIGTLAKPSFLIALIPAVISMAAYRQISRQSKVPWNLLLFSLLLPAAVVLLWQARVYGQLTGGSHAKFAPLATLSSMSNHLGMKFLLSILFPVVGYLLSFSAGRPRPRLNLAWLTFICGAMLTYLVTESRRTSHGNFLWSAQLALFVLFFETTRCVTEMTMLRWRAGAKRRVGIMSAAVCAIVFLAHVVYGIAYYSHLIKTPNTAALLYK